MNKKKSLNNLTVVDRIGMVYVVLNILGLFLFSGVANVFRKMYQDFGGEVPTITLLVLKPWFSILFALSGGIVFSLQWRKGINADIKQRRMIIITAFIIVLTASMVCIFSLWLPMLILSRDLTT